MNEKVASFHVVGLSVRTSNEGGKASQDIPALWSKFMSEQTAGRIPNAQSSDLYCVYTDYEGDHTQPYTTLLGCRVADLNEIPEGMTGRTIPQGDFERINVQGNLIKGAVVDAWMKIWDSNLDRKYSADYEVYGEKAQNPEAGEIDIYISLK